MSDADRRVTGRRGRFEWVAIRGDTVLTDAPVSINAGDLALAILTEIRIVETSTYGDAT